MTTAEQFSESMTVNAAIRAVPGAAAVFHRFDMTPAAVDLSRSGKLPAFTGPTSLL